MKEIEKTTKYQDLMLQVQKLWDVKATVIPTVVGALGTASEELENHWNTHSYTLLTESSIARYSFHP